MMKPPANQHDSTKFIDVLENISDFLNDDLIHAIVSAYADKGYDAAYIRNYLRCYGINCIPYKKEYHIYCSLQEVSSYNYCMEI